MPTWGYTDSNYLVSEETQVDNVNDKKLESPWLIVKALYRASGIGFVLLVAFLPFLFITDQTYTYHNSIVPMDRLTYNALMFLIFAEMKILIIVFLLLPAVGLHWTLANQRRVNQRNQKQIQDKEIEAPIAHNRGPADG